MQEYIYTELGKEKICMVCNEYYPYTKEFFYGTSVKENDGTYRLDNLCKACYKEKYRPHQKRCYDVSHRYANGVN